MNEKLINDLANTKFDISKYYKKIISEFLNGFELSRININDDLITAKANDRAGSREIYIKINDDGNLLIKVNRNIDFMRFQDIILYNQDGIMLERSNCQAELKKNVGENFKDNPDILAEEFNELGQTPTIYTNRIFNSIRFRKVKRPENFGLEALYTQKIVNYDERGLMNKKILEGTFPVLDSNSISVLDFPKDTDINIKKEEELNDNDIIEYPYSRVL